MCVGIRRWLPGLGLLVLAAGRVVACGYDFNNDQFRESYPYLSRPYQPVGLNMVEGCFDTSLLPKLDMDARLRRLDRVEPWKAPSVALSRETLERNELGEAYALVEAMRAASDEASAWAAGVGLEPAVRHYTAGARAFKAEDFALAREHFAAILALPADQQSNRGAWAQFMLGRVALAEARRSPWESPERMALAASAIQAFVALRGMAGDDPMELVKGSYGEEAAAAMLMHDDAHAASQYQAQAELGSTSGQASLWFLARQLLSNQDDLNRAIADPTLQQLVTAYLSTQNYLYQGEGNDYESSAQLQAYFSALRQDPNLRVVGADQFAAAAYRIGSFDLAARLVANNDSPMAAWVRAKLALRRGDSEAADQAYAQAAEGFRQQPNWRLLSEEPRSAGAWLAANRVDAEQGALAASRLQLFKAMGFFRRAEHFWTAMADLAEFKLSTDRLKQYLDQEWPEGATGNPDDRSLLSELLGRRLLREQRFDEAPGYFPASLREAASNYAEAMQRIPGQTGVARAKSRFAAARILRFNSWELLAPYSPKADWEPRDYRYRRMAAGWANLAADDLPPRSQAFAAVLCHATRWLLAKEPENADFYYRRYIRHGAAMAWADRFGQVCPEPDFDAAAVLAAKR
ncbi:MAG: hypothetical protein AB7V26_10020 [Lysobacterales bacterium]